MTTWNFSIFETRQPPSGRKEGRQNRARLLHAREKPTMQGMSPCKTYCCPSGNVVEKTYAKLEPGGAREHRHEPEPPPPPRQQQGRGPKRPCNGYEQLRPDDSFSIYRTRRDRNPRHAQGAIKEEEELSKASTAKTQDLYPRPPYPYGFWLLLVASRGEKNRNLAGNEQRRARQSQEEWLFSDFFCFLSAAKVDRAGRSDHLTSHRNASKDVAASSA